MNVAFTGHRDYDAERTDDTLYRRISEIASHGDVTFLCGMAVGFDLAAAEATLRIKDSFKSIRLKCIVPFADQSKYFSDCDQQRYARVLESADEIVVLESGYSSLVYLRRNDFLVDNADMIIAYYNNAKKSGTAYTVQRAKRAKLIIENLYPQQQLTLF